MAVVIPFAPRPASASTRAADGGAAPCAILFFTGIRYERHAEVEPVVRPTQATRPKRMVRKAMAKRARPPA